MTLRTLATTAGGMATPGVPQSPGLEQRLQRVEEKLDRILKKLDSLTYGKP